MRVIIRLKDKELGYKVAESLNPIAKIGGEVWNLPTGKEITDQEKTMLFNIGMPYPIDNYVLIEEKGSVEVFELKDEKYARLNRLYPDKLSGICQWKKYNHTFCRDSYDMLEALVAAMIGF